MDPLCGVVKTTPHKHDDRLYILVKVLLCAVSKQQNLQLLNSVLISELIRDCITMRVALMQ